MDPLHITEFASKRYFSKLRQLDGQAEPAAATASSTTNVPELPAALRAPTFTLPLRRQRSAESDNAAPALRPSDQKKRSLGHDLTPLRTQRRPILGGGLGALRSKISVTQKPISVGEHQQAILAADPTAATSLPKYTLKLYPVPDPQFINLHYLCGIWHRLQVALKLSTMITQQATKELFSRTTEAARLEFEPQSQRMCKRLTPLVFALFHFFETYRDLHVKHLTYGGVPLRMQAFTLNPIETQVMAMYDDHTLLKVHQVFPLILSSISRRLRPPSYAGRIERSIKGYLKDRPADEVYSSIVLVGGLRQAQRFWEKKGYNIRREAVDVWYSYITKTPVEAPPPKSKMARLATFGRKKTQPVVDTSSSEKIGHDLAAGPPMGPLTREQLRQLLPDQQDLKNIWVLTAEALILQRKIVSRPQDIKRNHMVLLELIGPDGPEVDEFTPAPPREGDALQQEGMGGDGGVSD
ncbi:hypothetical protein M7I_3307 [Glarea lozoyensis 74030]|uniref:Uncharacterized protein n=1 Tax=Glarea lozoyensis (strain ATCC 74030 / MF5533) TaxID=1104152 RepID=H0EKQ2_GLAL7|nr:hypothetical protein M7I_3307 [Glarea lozoyensis 74030]